MTKLFVSVSILLLVVAGCTRYPDAINIFPYPPETLPVINSSDINRVPGQSTAPAVVSQQWVTYGKTSYGDLRGNLLVPEGKGPFPAVIFNHGSRQQPEPKRAIARFFTDLGFVVLLPNRHGYGNSAGPTLDEAITLRLSTSEGKQQLVDRLRLESEDVLAALSYMKSLPFIDSKRIIISGHSFGGIATIYVAGKTPDFAAGVVFATASGTWRHGGLYRQELINAARAVKAPLLFIYAENDYDLSPGIVLSREVRRAGGPVSLKIYPPFGESEQEAHEIALREEGIRIWQKDVMEFIKRWME